MSNMHKGEQKNMRHVLVPPDEQEGAGAPQSQQLWPPGEYGALGAG